MNDERRAKLRSALSMLNSACQIVDTVKDEEQYRMDNMPENLQESDQYYKMEEAVDNLEAATDQISDVRDLIEEAMA